MTRLALDLSSVSLTQAGLQTLPRLMLCVASITYGVLLFLVSVLNVVLLLLSGRLGGGSGGFGLRHLAWFCSLSLIINQSNQDWPGK